MEFGVFLVLGCVGDGKFSKRNTFRVSWFILDKK